jgi:hypothetical protein
LVSIQVAIPIKALTAQNSKIMLSNSDDFNLETHLYQNKSKMGENAISASDSEGRRVIGEIKKSVFFLKLRQVLFY